MDDMVEIFFPVVTAKFAPWAVSDVSRRASEAASVATTTAMAAKKEAAGRGDGPESRCG